MDDIVKVDNEEVEKYLMWDILKRPTAKTLSEQLAESHLLGYPTTELANSFVTIANNALNRPGYRYLECRDDIVSEAVLAMYRCWQKVFVHDTALTYFYTVALNSGVRYRRQERIQQDIKEDLLAFLVSDDQH